MTAWLFARTILWLGMQRENKRTRRLMLIAAVGVSFHARVYLSNIEGLLSVVSRSSTTVVGGEFFICYFDFITAMPAFFKLTRSAY